MIITEKYLKENPSHIFVFGDNLLRRGLGGAAKLRNNKNTYGFITKKKPNNNDNSFYTCKEYLQVYKNEIEKLSNFIENNQNKIFLISKIGAGLANKYKIFENIIKPYLKKDISYKNVKFLY